MKRKKIIGLIIALVVIAAVFFGIYKANKPTTMVGSKEYTVTVVDDKGNKKTYEASTDKKYLGAALKELDKNSDEFSIKGTKSEYGTYITTVNGLKADYNKDKAYWSIYVNGKYGQNGVDSQTVKKNDKFRLVYEKGN